MKLWIIAVLLLAVAVGQAESPSDSVLERLSKVEQFAFGGTGYSGVNSQGEKDYWLILSRPSAMDDFEQLLQVRNLQAKCYVLVGIRTLDINRFKEISRSLRGSKEKVSPQSGCIISHEALTAVLKRIEAGEYSKAK